jgi:phosphonoacetaldehyde hydrolase
MSYIKKANGNELKMVILDLAGTTVDYGSCAPAAAFVELFARHNISISREQARGPMGMNKQEHIKALAENEEVAVQWHSIFGRSFNDHDLDLLYDEFVPLQLNILEKYGELIPGTLEAQHYFRARGIRIGVTTGYSREMAKKVLSYMEEQGFIPDVSVCSSDVAEGRPAPWMAITAARCLGIDSPESVVKIGDTIVDIEAGLNAGMWSIGVAKTGNMLGLSLEDQWELPEWEINHRLEEARMRMINTGAHAVIDSISDAPITIEQINTGLAKRKKTGIKSTNRFWITHIHSRLNTETPNKSIPKNQVKSA